MQRTDFQSHSFVVIKSYNISYKLLSLVLRVANEVVISLMRLANQMVTYAVYEIMEISLLLCYLVRIFFQLRRVLMSIL